MKKLLIPTIVLLSLLVLFGCNGTPDSSQITDYGNTEPPSPSLPEIPEDASAYSLGVDSLFKKGEDADEIKLTVILNKGYKFDGRYCKKSEDVTSWFTGLPSGVKAFVDEMANWDDLSSEKNNYASKDEKLKDDSKSEDVVVSTYDVCTVRFSGTVGEKSTEDFAIAITNSYLYDYSGDDPEIPVYIPPENNYFYYEEFKVTFILNNGEENIEKTVGIGDTVLAPSVQKEGYTLINWFLDDKPFDFTTKIYKDYTVEAKWDITGDEVTVTWIYDSVLDKKTTTKVKKGEKITDIPDGSKGVQSIVDTFKHWALTKGGTESFDFETKLNDHLTLYAVYNEYNIGDTVVVYDCTSSDPDFAAMKKNGMELVIIAKRGEANSLSKDYPFKYIGVDKNHDIPYYLASGDDKMKDKSNEDIIEGIGCTWAEADVTVGNYSSDIGKGYLNTAAAMAKEGELFNINGDDSIRTVWGALKKFRNSIVNGNGEYWFVPTPNEADIFLFTWKDNLNNLSNRKLNKVTDYANNCRYWTSTELEELFLENVIVKPLYCKHAWPYDGARMGSFTANKVNETCRLRLCRNI